jgi:DegV family protein with EDD domain
MNAARVAVQGASLKECTRIIEHMRANSGIFFVVNTLEYLRRGGRIGGAAAFLGTALNLKPILEVRNGRVEAVERVRTWSKAVDRVLDLFVEKIGDQRPIQLASLHANAPEGAQSLLERLKERFQPEDIRETILAEISPVLGAHTGPGCLGLVFVKGASG